MFPREEIDTSVKVKLNFKWGLFYEIFRKNASFPRYSAIYDGNFANSRVFKRKISFMRITFDYSLNKII